jgi:DUF1365 family protein
MQSCIYTGHIRHRRFVPKENKFHYALFLVYLDLDEMDSAFTGSPLWSVGRPNLAWLRRKDHLGDSSLSIEESVRILVEQKLGRRPAGPIRMLCHFRYFGHCFNPATFYYCFSADGKRIDSIVIEVHNTPWGEEYCYVLDTADNAEGSLWHYRQFDKSFHVSPFMGMDMHYDWRFRTPGEVLNIHMNNFHRNQKYFDATLTLQRREMTGTVLNSILFAYPLMTIKVVFMIHWQATLLWIKGVPFVAHP